MKKIKPVYIMIALAIAFLHLPFPATSAVNDQIILILEEPVTGSVYSGVSNIRGFAVAPTRIVRIERFVDGVSKGDIPYGGSRNDVGNAYPDLPNSNNSGFSMAYSYPLLAEGEHTIAVRAFDENGDFQEASATFNVARFEESFIQDPPGVSLSSANVSLNGETIFLDNVIAGGKLYDIVLQWRTASQSFAITRIVLVDNGDGEPMSLDLEEIGIPAGWISGDESNPSSFIDMAKSDDNCHTGSDCYLISYMTGGSWGGIYWWPMACINDSGETDWDKVKDGTCGISITQAGGFSATNRLTFWARGNQGGEKVEFRIGAEDILPTPPASTGIVTLSSGWQQYIIDVSNTDLSNAVGLFLWFANDDDNPRGAVFYLDDIQFEGVR